MWKVCQLLKTGRSHISRPRNANTSLSSPAQPSSSTSPLLQDESFEPRRYRANKRPVAYTPSLFRSFEEKKRKCDHSLLPVRLFSLNEENPVKEESSNEEAFGRESSESHSNHRRPGHDHDDWHCRCRCRFGEWLGYTTMVAATIHLSRVTVHLLPNSNERRDSNADGETGPRVTILSEFKDSVQNSWRKFLHRTAPVLFPDLFRQLYVLPTAQPRVGSSDSKALVDSKIAQAKNIDETALLAYDVASSSDSSTPSTPTTRTRSTSDDCAVQTEMVGIGTPFDDFMLDSGRRLAMFGRLTDVGLEHAIGVDLLKRQLYDEAIDYLLGAARSGHAGALYNLGICYSRGYGVRRDITKAVELWRSAADQGHGLSKFQMGVCHARGLGGLAMDHDRALRYMEAAASTGIPEAKTYLAANEYKQGRLEGALELLRQAVAGGDKKASDLLQDWPMKHDSNRQHHNKVSDGYVFENLAKEKSALPAAEHVAKRAAVSGRRRFWASSSSEKEDSLSTSSLDHKVTESSDSRSSSIVFGGDSSSEIVELKKETRKTPSIEFSGSRAMETVASLLTLGSLRRSNTAPDIHSYDNLDFAISTTGNIEKIDEV